MQSGVREQSFGTVRIFWLDIPLIIEQLRSCVSCLPQYPEVQELWVFGSFVSGKAVPGSDLDLLIRIDETDTRLIDRIDHYQPLFSSIGISVDIFPCISSESDMAIVHEAERHGLRVYSQIDPVPEDEIFSILLSRATHRRRSGTGLHQGSGRV